MVKLLLHWKMSLTSEVDKDGSTPLHFASATCFWTGLYIDFQSLKKWTWWPFIWCPYKSTWSLPILLDENPAALYQADKKGSFPIHVAATVGATVTLFHFIWSYPDSARLRDANGKTFLHVAIENGHGNTVSDVCKESDSYNLTSVLNMQDNDGNTALHLAIKAGSFRMFCALLGIPELNMNLTNKQGETPYDVSISKLRRGMNPVRVIHSSAYFSSSPL
jgi:ankyrin repeat protein